MISREDSVSSEQLKRLVESGLCTAQDAAEYMRNLRELIKDVGLAREITRRRSRVFKALSHPMRLRILRLLNARDMCVCEIMAVLNATQPTTSHHLNILENVRLIEGRHEGRWVFYSVAKTETLKRIQQLIQLL